MAAAGGLVDFEQPDQRLDVERIGHDDGRRYRLSQVHDEVARREDRDRSVRAFRKPEAGRQGGFDPTDDRFGVGRSSGALELGAGLF